MSFYVIADVLPHFIEIPPSHSDVKIVNKWTFNANHTFNDNYKSFWRNFTQELDSYYADFTLLQKMAAEEKDAEFVHPTFVAPCAPSAALCVIFTILVSFLRDNALFASKAKINVFWNFANGAVLKGPAKWRKNFKKRWF